MSIRIIDKITGTGVPVRGNDIDTDRIIPARFLKCVTFDGLGQNAFADDISALEKQGKTHPFRNPAYQGSKVLVSNSNFGCGSSREHAPQALMRWGIEAIIAESYSEIFFGNCVSLGIPCFKVEHAVSEKLLSWIEANPRVDMELFVETRSLRLGSETIALTIADGPRGQFLDGSWNARSGLLINLPKVREVAKTLPYMNHFEA
ncbi:MAG TPA: 3-isopropylmalate dehydratase small subunit [Fibrobacteraceae bacterium]|nr:3-isopropylmalate dehydratase small subunit [Fibrobacteraceae bacterium]